MASRLRQRFDDDERFRGIPRNQRHAVHRRDAGAADHLHGGGAARPPSTCRSTCRPRPPCHKEAGQADLCQHQVRPAVAIGETRSSASSWSPSLDLAEHRPELTREPAIFLRARPLGALWRPDGRDGVLAAPAAIPRSSWWLGRLARRCGAPGDRTGKALKAQAAMSDLELEQKPSRRLWIFAALTALALHLGGATLAVSHLRTRRGRRGAGRRRRRIRRRVGVAKGDGRDHPPAAGARCRCISGVAAVNSPSRRPRSRRPSFRRISRPRSRIRIAW